MDRAQFLAYVGDPDVTRARIAEKESEALRLWQTIRDAFYRKDGKPRRKPASYEAAMTRAESERLREQARTLLFLAGDQQREHDDPWSHIRPGVRERWGLPPAIDAVDPHASDPGKPTTRVKDSSS